MDFTNTSNVNNSNSNSYGNSNGSNSSNSYGVNFQLPQIDLSSISSVFNPRNFNIASNLEELMSFATKSNNKSFNGCDSCGLKFNLLKRKRTCADCNMDFCNGCLIKENGSDRRNHCKRCRVFNSRPLDRNALLGLRARDLKWFLASRRIPSQMCNEKAELVDLIIQSISPQTNTSNTSEYLRRFDNYSTNNLREPQITNQNESSNISPIPQNDNPLASNSSTENNATNSSQINENNSPSHSTSSQNTCETEAKNDSNTRFNIDDLSNAEQLKDLSVRQLKLILARNFIDYKGCVEKNELLTKALRLWNDRQENKQQNVDEISDINLCKICMESTTDCVLLECGHMVTCTNCGKRLNECPICRQYVIRVVHIFKA